jgi:uncharacterized protein
MDMSDAEGAVMEAHFAYWAQVIGQRRAVAYGPVMDPIGAYGIAVIEAADQSAAEGVVAADPAIQSSAGFTWELHPIQGAIVRP